MPDPKARRRQTLDALFARLKQAPSSAAARPIEAAILAAFEETNSPSINLLMERGAILLQAGDLEGALALYSAVIQLEPDFAAGWSRRGTVQNLRGRPDAARDDLRRALSLEPRDLAALQGLGAVLEEAGDKRGALDAYGRALALDPHLGDLAERSERLEQEIRGRGI